MAAQYQSQATGSNFQADELRRRNVPAPGAPIAELANSMAPEKSKDKVRYPRKRQS
jgi:dolichyl-phosphate-mannose-protein mannosyltransferase